MFRDEEYECPHGNNADTCTECANEAYWEQRQKAHETSVKRQKDKLKRPKVLEQK